MNNRESMYAAYLTAPEQLEVRKIAVPHCGREDILIKTHACGICGSDVRTYNQGLKDGIAEQVMGHEFTGIVTEVGPDVSRFQPGDRIAVAPDVSCGSCYYCRRGLVNLCSNHRMLGLQWPGGFAEYVHIPKVVQNRGMIHHMPEGLSLDAAVLSEPASSVIACQEMIDVKLGDTVLIIGDGPIGCLHVQIARARGASRIFVAGKRRLEILRRFEPDLIIDGGSEDIPAACQEATGGLGVDKAIIANRRASSQELGLQSLRKRGVLVLFGGVSKADPYTSLNSNTIHYNEITVIGSFSYTAVVHQQALRFLADGIIDPEPFLGAVFPLHEIEAAFRHAAAGSDLKIVVRP